MSYVLRDMFDILDLVFLTRTGGPTFEPNVLVLSSALQVLALPPLVL